MGASKELFMEMRAEDLALMYSHDFTKKKAVETGEKLVAELFERGETDPIKVFSNIVRLKAVIDTAEKQLREKIDLPNADTFNGVTFTPKKGSEKLNYEEDRVCRDLGEKLKQRQELVKLATKSKDIIFDSEGCEVPKVSSKFDKPSITITF